MTKIRGFFGLRRDKIRFVTYVEQIFMMKLAILWFARSVYNIQGINRILMKFFWEIISFDQSLIIKQIYKN